MKKLFFIVLLANLVATSISAQHTIEVKHKYYTLEFDTVLKSPLISWYIQTTAHATLETKIDRKSVAAFHQDPLIDAKYQVANDKQYKNNGHFDKGHLSPYSAFYFELEAAKESMFYTNTAPQFSFFNEHPWERLEQHILKDIAPFHDSIAVHTGCLYGEQKMNDVPIPDYYWKVIVYEGWEYVWLAKNEETTNTDYSVYAIDVDKLIAKIHSYYPKLKLNF